MCCRGAREIFAGDLRIQIEPALHRGEKLVRCRIAGDEIVPVLHATEDDRSVAGIADDEPQRFGLELRRLLEDFITAQTAGVEMRDDGIEVFGGKFGVVATEEALVTLCKRC